MSLNTTVGSERLTDEERVSLQKLPTDAVDEAGVLPLDRKSVV